MAGRIRKTFRKLNFHVTEEGKVIRHFAKKLPPEERKEVLVAGEKYCAAKAKKNLPRGTRNVITSLVIGQGMWYLVCPIISHIPGIRDSSLGWLAWGGADKLFLEADNLLYTTGGFSTTFAKQIALSIPSTAAIGSGLIAAELIADFSKCWVEYWTQKKYGIVADGVARAYGQTRPFMVRYSSLEVWQKAISYALKPWTIGTPRQIFSSMQGILGSLWRIGPQLAIVITLGRAVDKIFKKIAEWTGLKRIADRIRESGEKAEEAAMQKIKEVLSPEKFLALKYMLAAESRKTWKWNPFRPALSVEKAEKASQATVQFENGDIGFGECFDEMNHIFGKRPLKRIPDYRVLTELTAHEEWDADIADYHLSRMLDVLQTVRELS